MDTGAEHFHAVRFYKDSESLSRIVAQFLAEGFSSDQPAIVVATPPHVAAIEKHLEAAGIDVQRLRDRGEVVLLDADALLSEFMVDGMPDSGRFVQTLTPILEATAGPGKRRIRAYGEMVDVLWKAGQTVPAIRLETLWNALAHAHAFSLLCGYSIGNFYKDAAVDDICGQHSHVVSDSGAAARVN